MTDTLTRRKLQVSTLGTVGPYLMLAYSQLPELRQVLEQHQIRYWVEENLVSLNNGPAIATVNFGRGGVASQIQAILDDMMGNSEAPIEADMRLSIKSD